MKNYNKNSKLFYMIFLGLGFGLLILAIVYMTQYSNLFLYKTNSGFGSDPDGNIQNNTHWLAFLANPTGDSVVEQIKVLLGLPTGIATDTSTATAAFTQSCPIIREYYEGIQKVNWTIFYFAISSLVLVAIGFLFSNHSRRIYYKSNLVIGVFISLAIIAFGLLCVVTNTSLISGMNEHHTLLNTLDYICSSALHGADITDPNFILGINSINPTTIIVTDIYLAVVIGYAAFMLVYTIRRYNDCEAERKDIIAKAVSLDE